jgi:hypothetical protein
MLCRILCVLLFLAWTAEIPNDTVIYEGHWRSVFEFFGPLFATIPGVSLTPWQLIVFALAPVCLLMPSGHRRRAWLMDAAIFVSFASVAVTFLWGWTRGGSAYHAYYQLWRFLLALLFALMLLAAVRGRRDLKRVGATLVVAAVVRAILAIYFYWFVVMKNDFDPPPLYMTTHDDSLLFITALLITLAYALFRASWKVWSVTWLAWGLLLYAIVLNNRRLAWLELVLSLFCVVVMLPRGSVRRRVNRGLLVAAPVLVLYVAIGWGRSGAFFEPVRALSTSGSNEDASSLARQEEIRNLMYTLSVAGNPLLGTGWGVPYQQVSGVYTQFEGGWEDYGYRPHNSLMAVVVFGGLTGLFGIWMVVPVTAFLASSGLRLGPGPIESAAAVSAAAMLPAYGIQCYGDLGFQSVTCGLILASAMAAAAKVSVLVPAVQPRPERERVLIPRLQPVGPAAALSRERG